MRTNRSRTNCALTSLLWLAWMLALPVQAQIGQQPPTGSGGVPGSTTLTAGTDLSAAFANVSNNDLIQLGEGQFSINPSNNVNSNEPFGPLRLINKTNVTIRGAGWGTQILGANAGTWIVASNCYNLRIEDMLFDGQWSGFTSNGINGVHAVINLAGTNNNVKIAGCKFQRIPGFAIVCSYRSTLVDYIKNLSVIDCFATQLGNTNNPGVGQADGGFWAGAVDGMNVTGCHVEDSLRGFELFAAAGNGCTNIVIANSIFMGLTTAILNGGTEVTGLVVANCTIDGGTNHPTAAFANQKGVVLGDNFRNTLFDGVVFVNIDGYTVHLNGGSVGTGISNLTFNACTFSKSGVGGVEGGSILIADASGGSVIQGITVRNSLFTGLVGDGILMTGGRDIIIENNKFIDISTAAACCAGVRLQGGADIESNIVVRANHFQNFATTKSDHALNIDSGAMNVRFLDNIVTNMGVGAVSDSSGSLTLWGEQFSYASVMDLPSIPVSQSYTTNLSTPLTRTNWSALVYAPNQLYTATGSNAVVTAWCSNAVTYVRVSNNDTVTAFDPPAVRYRVFVRQVEALP